MGLYGESRGGKKAARFVLLVAPVCIRCGVVMDGELLDAIRSMGALCARAFCHGLAEYGSV